MRIHRLSVLLPVLLAASGCKRVPSGELERPIPARREGSDAVGQAKRDARAPASLALPPLDESDARLTEGVSDAAAKEYCERQGIAIQRKHRREPPQWLDRISVWFRYQGSEEKTLQYMKDAVARLGEPYLRVSMLRTRVSHLRERIPERVENLERVRRLRLKPDPHTLYPGKQLLELKTELRGILRGWCPASWVIVKLKTKTRKAHDEAIELARRQPGIMYAGHFFSIKLIEFEDDRE